MAFAAIDYLYKLDKEKTNVVLSDLEKDDELTLSKSGKYTYVTKNNDFVLSIEDFGEGKWSLRVCLSLSPASFKSLVNKVFQIFINRHSGVLRDLVSKTNIDNINTDTISILINSYNERRKPFLDFYGEVNEVLSYESFREKYMKEN